MPAREQQLDGLGDVARIALAVVAERDRIVRRGLGDALMPAASQPWKTARVLGGREPCAAASSVVEVDVLGAAVGVGELRARDGERRAQLDERQHAALRGRRRPRGASTARSTRPRFVAECSQPCGPVKSTSLRAASAGASRSRASSSMQLPARLGDRRVLAQQMAHAAAPLQAADAERLAAGSAARRAPPRPRRPPPRPPRRARRCRRPGTGRPARSRATAACAAGGTRGPCRSA